jgi:hypothetical protein
LREPKSSAFISFVWCECDFWRDPMALGVINGKGMCLMDYVIESCDDLNLLTFMIHDLNERSQEMSSDKNYYLKIKSEIYLKKSGMSIFSKIYTIIQSDDSLLEYCLIILNEILKEMKEIVDIRREVKIDSVLSMPDGCKIQDELLRLLIKYWKVNSKDYHYYRNAFCEISPFYRLFLSLKENDEDEFEDTFPEYLDYIRQNLCPPSENFNLKLQEHSSILLTLALETGMRKAMQVRKINKLIF